MSDMTIDTNAHVPGGNMQTDAAAQQAGGSNNDGKVKDKATAAAEALVALAQKAVTISTTTRAQGHTATGASGRTGVPILDNPEDPKAIQQDLEKLIAFLQMDNDQHQGELARARIESQQSAMDRVHKDRLSKIDESIKAAEKAAQAAKASRILGWIGVALAFVAAVVVSVATGGVAAGVAWAGFAIAATQLVLSETGAADKIINNWADGLQEKYGMSKATAQAWAGGLYSAMFAVAGLATGFTGLGVSAFKAVKATVDVMSTAARIATFTTQILNLTLALTSSGVGIAQTVYGKDAAEAGAEVKDINRFMALLQQMLDESKDELQQIMDQLQSVFSKLVAIIQSKTDTGNLIMQNLSQMV